jgi:hypothetical protein
MPALVPNQIYHKLQNEWQVNQLIMKTQRRLDVLTNLSPHEGHISERTATNTFHSQISFTGKTTKSVCDITESHLKIPSDG